MLQVSHRARAQATMSEMRPPRPMLSRLRDAPKSFKVAEEKIGEGSLDFTGFCELVKDMEGSEQPVKVLRARFDKIDIDNDGMIDKSEYFAGTILEALVGADISKLFATMDTDNNHSISRQEFANAIKKLLNFAIPRATSDITFSLFDDDNSGEIDYREECYRGSNSIPWRCRS